LTPPRPPLLLWRSGWRQMTRRPGQIILAVLGVALGVAVVVAIDLASGSAERAFRLATTAVAGRATHQVVGGPGGLPDALFSRLVVAAGVTAAPVVEDYVVVPAAPAGPGGAGRPGRVLHLLGVDPFSEGALRPRPSLWAPASGTAETRPADSGLAALLLHADACLLAAPTARELGLRTGDTFRVLAGGRPRLLRLSGELAAGGDDAREALGDLMVMDIAAAQELLGRIGRLDRIDLRLPPTTTPDGEAVAAATARTAASSGNAATIRAVRALLPPGAELLAAADAERGGAELTRAFRINLTALSLLALLCGAFLIYNTVTFSVVQRRPLLGTLRTLGVTRGQVLALVLLEALAVALAGTACGLLGGVALGRVLLGLVTRTINDLYFVVSVRRLSLSPASLLTGAALGIGATLAAALAPALEAALTPPRGVLARSLLELRLRRLLPRATMAGCGLVALGALLLALPAGDGLVTGFLGLGAATVGSALLAPAATVGLMRLLRAPLGALLGLRGRMAAGGVVASLSRTAVAIAALMVAVAVTIGIGVMIASFRHTVVTWLEGELQADIYVAAPAGAGGYHGAPLGPDLAARAAAVPGVAAVHSIRRVELATAAGPVRLLAVDNDRRGYAGLELLEGNAEEVWRRVAQGGEALVSEPFSRRHGVHRGATLRLPAAAGESAIRVAGVFYDYASDLGVVMLSRRTYVRLWHDQALSGISLDVAPEPGTAAPGARAAAPGTGRASDAAVARTMARLRQALGPGQALSIQSNRALKRLSLAIFDRTFLITGVLRLLAGLVAAIGVLSALTALQLERSREIAVLRATGLTPGQVWQLVITQTGLMGLAAGLMALPVGLTLSAIMVYVINRRSFGWTIHLEASPGVLIQALLLALGTAVAAGLYPAWRMARTRPALALRDE
jgi:putative ABC transport system permease protein